MSTLWTPGGEVPVSRTPPAAEDSTDSQGAAEQGAAEQAAPADPLEEASSVNLDELSPEERERAEEAIRTLAETRERMLAVPASVVVANHAMGLYELAALHLANQPPNFAEAAVSIDALGALLDGMIGRLGEPEATLRDGLDQIRLAFVKLKNAAPEQSD